MSKFVVSGMRDDFPKPSNIGVSGNPLRAMNETNIKLAKVFYIIKDLKATTGIVYNKGLVVAWFL
jgi:hypothetical protein